MSDGSGARSARGMQENIVLRLSLLEKALHRRSATIVGEGAPEGVIPARRGTLYMRSDGTPGDVLYAKVSGDGATGWVLV